MMLKRWTVLLLLLNTLGFFTLIMLSNIYDWDAFFTSNEVDYRSWILHGTPPMWSYQLCGGITRIGDPQSIGMSPLFLPILLLGSFWGVKLLVLLCMGLGLWFTKQTLALLVSPQTSDFSDDDHLCLWVIAQMFVMSNFFVWHLQVGHLTFCLFYLGMGIVYFTCKAWRGLFRRRDWFGGILLTGTYYTSAFFQSSVYFLLPIFLTIALLLGIQMVWLLYHKQSLWPWLRNVRDMLGFHIVGLMLGGFKLYHLLLYQKQFPRTLPYHTKEIGSWVSFFWNQLSPTWNFGFWGIWEASAPPPYVWERSFFNLSIWVLFFYLGYRIIRRFRVPPATPVSSPVLESWLWPALLLYACMVSLFAWGEGTSWAPHTILRRWIGEIRVIERYHIGFTWLITVTLTICLHQDIRFRQRFSQIFAIPLLCLLGGNFFLFTSGISWNLMQHYRLASSQTRSTQSRMNHVVFTKPYSFYHSYMYLPVLQGYSVLNCYNPLRNDRRIQSQLRREGIPVRDKQGNIIRYLLRTNIYHFIDTHHTKVPSTCLQRSYFTQHQIHIDASCPPKLCLNLSQINLYTPSEFRYHPPSGRYCRGF